MKSHGIGQLAGQQSGSAGVSPTAGGAPMSVPAAGGRSPKIPVSVLVVIHTDDGQVLLLERADRPGFWQSVTGSLDAPDEAPAVAGVRELREETGLDVGDGRFYGLDIQNRYEIYAHWRHRYAPGVTHNTEHVFALALSGPREVRLAPREHLRSEWLDWESAAGRCFSPSNAEAIRLLAQRHGWPGAGGARPDDNTPQACAGQVP